MKRKTIPILLVMIVLGLIFGLTGCLTKEQKQELDNFETIALKYYEEKYGELPQIESCGYYVDSDSLFPMRTDHKFARCKDNTIIFYDAKRDLIVDNRQSEEISAAIEEELLALMEEATALVQKNNLVILDYCSSSYAANFEGNFYHSYYDGNIKDFLATEDVHLTANLYLLCDKDEPWEDAQKKCDAIIRDNFRGGKYVTLTIMSSSCFNEKFDSASIKDLGCYAQYIMTDSATECYVQSYIKIADGIYGTCAEKNFIFEDGDIFAVEAISEDNLNTIIYERYDKLPDNASQKYCVASASSPVYQFEFSDRVKNAFSDGEVAVYLMYVPEEAGVTEGEEIIQYINKDENCICSSITTNNGEDAVRTVINMVDYYFIGSYLRVDNSDG